MLHAPWAQGACACCARPSGAAQQLEEVEWARGACGAAQRGDLPRLTHLLERRRGAALAGAGGYTPLHHAAREGHTACCALLLDAGALVDARTAGGATSLHRAAFTGQAGVVQLLLARGADAAAVDSDGETAAHKAASQAREGAC